MSTHERLAITTMSLVTAITFDAPGDLTARSLQPSWLRACQEIGPSSAKHVPYSWD